MFHPFTHKKIQISLRKMLRNKQYHVKVLLKIFHLNAGNTTRFRPQIVKKFTQWQIMVNLTISESIKMVNLLNQLQANCWFHTSPLMQYGCTTTFSQEKDDFSANNTGHLEDWKLCIPNRSPAYDILVTSPDSLLLLRMLQETGRSAGLEINFFVPGPAGN